MFHGVEFCVAGEMGSSAAAHAAELIALGGGLLHPVHIVPHPPDWSATRFLVRDLGEGEDCGCVVVSRWFLVHWLQRGRPGVGGGRTLFSLMSTPQPAEAVTEWVSKARSARVLISLTFRWCAVRGLARSIELWCLRRWHL